MVFSAVLALVAYHSPSQDLLDFDSCFHYSRESDPEGKENYYFPYKIIIFAIIQYLPSFVKKFQKNGLIFAFFSE